MRRVKGSEHFAHDRDDRDLRLLADGNEAAVEGAQRRVEPERGQGRHVERVFAAEPEFLGERLAIYPSWVLMLDLFY